jgi:hypothetical protein
MTTLYHSRFALPTELDKRVALIEALPRDWEHPALTTQLYAPRVRYEEGTVVPHTVLSLDSHWNSVEIEREHVRCWEERDHENKDTSSQSSKKLNILDLVINKKNPALVKMENVGWRDQPISFSQGIDLVTHFIKQGYQGFISAYSFYHYVESMASFKHAHININFAFNTIQLKFPDETEKNERLGSFIARLNSLAISEKTDI